MDTHLLAARLYLGSGSPGGGPYRYTAAIQPAQAATLVAAFNGGFKMPDAHGGYYTDGREVVPLVTGAASLVIYFDGSVTVGSWGTTVRMTPSVVSVRQNLVPLVAGGLPTPTAMSPDWQVWGDTCAARSCALTVPGIDHQWRSAVGVTADGALVYVTGPALDPPQLARVLVRAGVVRGMELDINPFWPVLATYARHVRRPGDTSQWHPAGARIRPRPQNFLRPHLDTGLHHHVGATATRLMTVPSRVLERRRPRSSSDCTALGNERARPDPVR